MDSALNRSQSRDPAPSSTLTIADACMSAMTVLLSAFILTANTVTVLVVRRTAALRTLSNMYVVSLALTDLVVGLSLLPLAAFFIPEVRVRAFDQNLRACALLLGVNVGMSTLSATHMALIATDRYLYIVRPFAYRRLVNRTLILVLLSLTWALCTFYALLPQLILNHEADRCDSTRVMPIGYLAYTNLTIYTSLVLLGAILYGLVIRTARSKSKTMQRASLGKTFPLKKVDDLAPARTSETSKPPDRRQSIGVSSVCGSPGVADDARDIPGGTSHTFNPGQGPLEPSPISERTDGKELDAVDLGQGCGKKQARSGCDKRGLRNIRFFLIVFGVFFVCLTPAVTCMALDYSVRVHVVLYNLCNLLALTNSGMNFFIFLSVSSTFRSAVRKVLGRGILAQNRAVPAEISYISQ